MTLLITRLRFTVQSGEAWVLTKEDISSSFSSVNVLDVNFINPYKTAGFLFFNDQEDAKKTDNNVVEVKGCLIHAHVDLNTLPPFPSDHQILIRSQCLPNSWEKAIIVRKFFESFGEVTGIIMKKQMLVISFKKAIATRLTGRLLQVKFTTIIIAEVKVSDKSKMQVPWDSLAVFVREVSCLTITNTTRTIYPTSIFPCTNRMLTMNAKQSNITSPSHDTSSYDTSNLVDSLLGHSPPGWGVESPSLPMDVFPEHKLAQQVVSNAMLRC